MHKMFERRQCLKEKVKENKINQKEENEKSERGVNKTRE